MDACADCLMCIPLFLDEELGETEKKAFLAHLEQCRTCRYQLTEQQSFSRLVRRSRPAVLAPADLRRRIGALVQETHDEAQMAKSLQAPQRTLSFPRHWLPLAFAAVLCVFAILSFIFSAQSARTERFLQTAIEVHRTLVGTGLPLDLTSSSSQQVDAWFQQRVLFPFRIPNEGIAVESRARYQLRGGRLVMFDGEPAAVLIFEMPSHELVSMLVVSARYRFRLRGVITRSDGIVFHSFDRDRTHAVAWEHRGVACALIFDSQLAGGTSCGSCHSAHAVSAHIDDPHAVHVPVILEASTCPKAICVHRSVR